MIYYLIIIIRKSLGIRKIIKIGIRKKILILFLPINKHVKLDFPLLLNERLD